MVDRLPPPLPLSITDCKLLWGQPARRNGLTTVNSPGCTGKMQPAEPAVWNAVEGDRCCGGKNTRRPRRAFPLFAREIGLSSDDIAPNGRNSVPPPSQDCSSSSGHTRRSSQAVSAARGRPG